MVPMGPLGRGRGYIEQTRGLGRGPGRTHPVQHFLLICNFQYFAALFFQLFHFSLTFGDKCATLSTCCTYDVNVVSAEISTEEIGRQNVPPHKIYGLGPGYRAGPGRAGCGCAGTGAGPGKR